METDLKTYLERLGLYVSQLGLVYSVAVNSHWSHRRLTIRHQPSRGMGTYFLSSNDQKPRTISRGALAASIAACHMLMTQE